MAPVKTFTAGKLLLALALLSIGCVLLTAGHFPYGFMPVPKQYAEAKYLVYPFAALLCVAAIWLVYSKYLWFGSILSGVLFILILLVFDLPVIIAKPLNPNIWTGFCEALSILAGLAAIAGADTRNRYNAAFNRSARWFFIFCLLVFGLLHVLYAAFIGTLIPAWLPGHSFFNSLVIIGFWGTALALIVNYKVRLATILLASMFAVWFIVLHLPRAFTNFKIEAEWTSAFIALAMAGVSLLMNTTMRKNNQ